MKSILTLILGLFLMSGGLLGAKPIEDVNLKNVFANKFYSLNEKGSATYLSKDDIKSYWEAKLKEQGYNVVLENFEILTSSENGKNYYFLKASSTDKIIEIGTFFTITKDGMSLALGKECTCTGCPNGCHLVITGSNCNCTGCTAENSSCTKTEKILIPDTVS